MKPSLRIYVLCYCLALAACTSQQTVFTAQSPGQLQQWSIKGKIALKTPNEGHSANLSWNQKQDQYEIRLNGPLGSGAIELEGNSHSATLRNSNGEYHANSARELLERMSGLAMPVDMLRWWIRGLPSPDASVSQQRYSENGDLIYFEQLGWVVEPSRYNAIEQLRLPYKLRAGTGEFQIKLAIKNWGKHVSGSQTHK
ncbi:lipoprotein insertase outer membrane protein LolB [Agaribacterium sp. ZY112]|uniref:lipoprotein insertase outer membrane protein LolB n=1 Tax=Agaribacterium sp. ZY112 TaxID=3233574 RepID=UPI003524CED5